VTARSHVRGHPVVYVDGEWRYEDGAPVPADPAEERPCPICGEPPTPEGYDACIGHVPGATSVCCGHGVAAPIYMLEAPVTEPPGARYPGEDTT
jgi:hypothetical protein